MAQSKNHQFIAFQDHVVARYVKVGLNSITGWRLDPYDSRKRIDFFLSTPEKNFDFTTKMVTGFTYDDEVLELYSEEEHKAFQRYNRLAIESGIFKPYLGEAEKLDDTNLLDDTQIEEIAKIPNLKALEKRLRDLTSVVTLDRILEMMQELGRKDSFRHLVMTRKQEVERAS